MSFCSKKLVEETLLSLSELKWKKKAGIAVTARSSSGGFATLWVEDIFSLENSFKTQHWIFTEIRHLASKTSLSIFNLYVPVNFQEKNIVGRLLQSMWMQIYHQT